nr:ABC transporter transmembrane domain-containing protein [uncultured Brevundimonas sp.]
MRRLLRGYLRQHTWRIVAALICMVIVAAATAAFTQLMKPIINDIFVNRREEMLLSIAMAALAVFVAKGTATFGQSVLMSYVGHRTVATLQQELYDSLIKADLGFFHRNAPGELVSRFISDITRLRNAVSDTMTGLGKDSLTALALVGVMFLRGLAARGGRLLCLPDRDPADRQDRPAAAQDLPRHPAGHGPPDHPPRRVLPGDPPDQGLRHGRP